MVLFHTPTKKITVELGLVISVFKGVKAPKLHPGDVPISSCSALALQRQIHAVCCEAGSSHLSFGC